MLWMNADTGEVNFGECNRRLAILHADGKLTEPEWSAFAAISSFNAISLHYTDQADMKRWISGRFVVEETCWANDYPRSECHPIWIMRRTETQKL